MPKTYLEMQEPGSREQRVSFHELAEFELNDAAIFFEIKREGLGLRFLLVVEVLFYWRGRT